MARTHRSAEQIAEFFDSIGGDLNTGCGNNSWFWQANCLTDDFAKTMEAYADVVNNPSFPDEELKPMKERIAAEIASEDADWEQQSLRFFKKKYYGPQNSPYQFLVAWDAGKCREVHARRYEEVVRRKGSRQPARAGDLWRCRSEDGEDTGRELFRRRPEKRRRLRRSSAEQRVPPADQATPFINVERVEVNPTEQKLAGIFIGFDAHPVIGDPINFPITVADTMCSGYGYPTGYLFDTLARQGVGLYRRCQEFPGQSTENRRARFW